MAIIALEGMRFFGYHGLYDAEKTNGNHFEVDVWIDTGGRPLAQSDDITDTVDYALVHAYVQEVMADRANLLETLVSRIGTGLGMRLQHCDFVRVRVSKLNPPVEGECTRSYVEDRFVVGGSPLA